jgi:ACS family D-galactonate transporter-like MFS transporter
VIVTVSNARRWGIVSLLFMASLINYLDRATLAVALPAIARDLAFGPALKGILLSAFFWSYAAMQLPIGWLADRVNLRWLYAGLFALWSLACGLTGFAGSLAVLVALRMLLGVGESIYLAGGTKIVAAFFAPAERGLPSGLFDSGSRAGLAIGAPLVALLILRYGWRRMFFLVGFSALLWLIPWLGVFPSGFTGTNAALERRTSRTEASAPRLDRNLLGICLGFFCFGYYWYLLVTWLPDYLVEVRRLSILRAGAYASLPYLIFGICMPLGGWIADLLIRSGWDETRARKGLLTVAFLCGLMLLPAARVANPRTALTFFCAASMVGLATGNMMAIVQGCAPPARLGLWTGWENFAGNLGGVLSPLTTGFLIAHTGSYFPGFGVAVLVLLAGLLCYWIVVGELKPSEHQAEP